MRTNTSVDDFLGDVWDTRDLIDLLARLDPESEDEDEREEYRRARELEELVSEVTDYRYGETMISDSYFEDYARELADDIGAIDKDAGWPMSYIDWEAAAEALQQDYTPYEFEGVTYWARA